jgi:hypothetical protein
VEINVTLGIRIKARRARKCDGRGEGEGERGGRGDRNGRI